MWIMISWERCSKRSAWQDEMSKTRRFQRLDNVGIVFTLMTSRPVACPEVRWDRTRWIAKTSNPQRLKIEEKKTVDAGVQQMLGNFLSIHKVPKKQVKKPPFSLPLPSTHTLYDVVLAKRQPMQTHFIIEEQNQEGNYSQTIHHAISVIVRPCQIGVSMPCQPCFLAWAGCGDVDTSWVREHY